MKQNTMLNFSTKLLSLLSDTENSVISPYGIAAVLSMAAEGASESSLREILNALDYDSLDELRAAVLAQMERPCAAFHSENSLALMRGENDLRLLEPFREVMVERYCAAVEEKDSDGEGSVMLKSIASFKAEWLHKMERDASGERYFHHSDGTRSRPAFLTYKEKLRHYRDKQIGTPTVQAVALPYKLDGEAIPFELVLVDSERPLTEKLLGDILVKMRTGQCEVKFPEFSIHSEFDLIPMMNGLGLCGVFDEYNEAFDRVATEPLYAAAFEQKAEIQVDEQGTVAKAITSMYMYACKSCLAPERLCFSKPFHYFLRNTNTGAILFMGKVNRLEDC